MEGNKEIDTENPLGKENITQSDPCQPQIIQTTIRAQSRL